MNTELRLPGLWSGFSVLAIFAVASWHDSAAAQQPGPEVLADNGVCWQKQVYQQGWWGQEVIMHSAEVRNDVSRNSGKNSPPGYVQDFPGDTYVYVYPAKADSYRWHKVPCPGTAQSPGPGGVNSGFYIGAGIGGGGSKPTVDNDLTGSGSGFGGNVHAGFRWRNAASWGDFNFGADWLNKDESLAPPNEDFKVRPGAILHQSMSLGFNIPTSTQGQWFAPYVAVGVGEANIKVSTPTFSDSHWTAAPMIGGGIDYRLTPNWLIHTNVSTYFFDHRFQFTGGAPFPVNERITTGNIGLIYQFSPMQ